MSSSALNKYKERISLYEDIDNPIAPLSPTQRQFIIDITHGDNQRPAPAGLQSIPVQDAVVFETDSELPADVNWDKFQFRTKREV